MGKSIGAVKVDCFAIVRHVGAAGGFFPPSIASGQRKGAVCHRPFVLFQHDIDDAAAAFRVVIRGGSCQQLYFIDIIGADPLQQSEQLCHRQVQQLTIKHDRNAIFSIQGHTVILVIQRDASDLLQDGALGADDCFGHPDGVAEGGVPVGGNAARGVAGAADGDGGAMTRGVGGALGQGILCGDLSRATRSLSNRTGSL